MGQYLTFDLDLDLPLVIPSTDPIQAYELCNAGLGNDKENEREVGLS